MLGAVALPAQAALRHIDGPVLSKNAANGLVAMHVETRGGGGGGADDNGGHHGGGADDGPNHA